MPGSERMLLKGKDGFQVSPGNLYIQPVGCKSVFTCILEDEFLKTITTKSEQSLAG